MDSQHTPAPTEAVGSCGTTAYTLGPWGIFGFLAIRPRIHDLAYAVAFMLLALSAQSDPAPCWRQLVPLVIEAYESMTVAPLTDVEREALAVYTAAVPLYFMALAGFNTDPVRQLHAYRSFLCLSEWLLSQQTVPSAQWLYGIRISS